MRKLYLKKSFILQCFAFEQLLIEIEFNNLYTRVNEILGVAREFITLYILPQA
jgi:hypothetical protein